MYKISQYYAVNDDIPRLGLFKDPEWCGDGNFCGWYSAEYYKNTILIADAFYSNYYKEYQFSYPNKEYIYDRVRIKSSMCEIIITNVTEQEAIEYFLKYVKENGIC